MKKYLILTFLIAFIARSFAQEAKSQATLKDLAVPSSPAFIITDVSPTLVHNPNTPKSFVLGVAQSFQASDSNFPNNYSAEFTPYWWVKTDKRSVYSYLGLKKNKNKVYKADPFAGLKYTSISVAFVSKDLIPDAVTTSQKVFSIGVRSTLIKAYRANYAKDLNDLIEQWHTAAQNEIDTNQNIRKELTITGSNRTDEQFDAILSKWQSKNTADILKKINGLIERKPKFNLDVAAGSSTYGIDDNTVKSGRMGAWSSATFNLPFCEAAENKNYFSISASFRYLADNFQKNAPTDISFGDSYDTGGKASFEFDRLSLGIESLYRKAKGVSDDSFRTVGVLNVKIKDDLFISGSFGKDFAGYNKLITAFGINWGLGKEKVEIK